MQNLITAEYHEVRAGLYDRLRSREDVKAFVVDYRDRSEAHDTPVSKATTTACAGFSGKPVDNSPTVKQISTRVHTFARLYVLWHSRLVPPISPEVSEGVSPSH